MLDKFDYNSYRKFLIFLLRDHQNFRFVDTLKNTDNKYFILRHDVDFSPDAALKMANIESKMGIKATYFLLLNSVFYNILSSEYNQFPRKLIEMGHEVGLHYDLNDLNFYQKFKRNPQKMLKFQVDILENIIDDTVHSISMHNPSVHRKDPFLGNDEFINAYNPRYTKEINYYSDSCGAWRKSTIDAFNAKKIPRKFQLLIHPIFWNTKHAERWDRLQSFIESRITNFYDQRDEIFQLWSQHSDLIEYENWRKCKILKKS